ncbi:MAG TPA: YetF domain-containing protein [Ramlibacter sp.]|nr:YetF domain-containing protein [Ramlibacter sp.]
MFDMQLPWWEFAVRAGVVYLVLLAMVRLTGKRTVGQFTPFDLIVVLLLSEAVSGSIAGQDESLTGGLIAAATLLLLNVLIAFASSRSQRIDTLVEGNPVLVGRDGVIYEDVLRRERVTRSDVDKALREADCELRDMRMAILEADGVINIMKKQPS